MVTIMEQKITQNKKTQQLSSEETLKKGLSVFLEYIKPKNLIYNSGITTIGDTAKSSHHLVKPSGTNMSDNLYVVDANTNYDKYMGGKLPTLNNEIVNNRGIAQQNIVNLEKHIAILKSASSDKSIDGLKNLGLPKRKSFFSTFGISGLMSFVTGIAQPETIQDISTSLRDKSADYIKRYVRFSSTMKEYGKLQTYLTLIGAMQTIYENDDLTKHGDATKAAAEYDLEKNKGMTKLTFGAGKTLIASIAKIFRR